MTFTDNHDGTATLSGTPTTPAGPTPDVHRRQWVPARSSQTLTVTVVQAPAITSATSATFTAGTAGTFPVTTTGNRAPTDHRVRALPSGVTFIDNGNGTATLAGTPATGSGGVPDHHHRQQRGQPQRHPELHPDVSTRRPCPGDHQRQLDHLHRGHAGLVHGDGHREPDGDNHRDRCPACRRDLDRQQATARPHWPEPRRPGAQAAYPITIGASNRVNPNVTQNFTLTVNSGPEITSPRRPRSPWVRRGRSR